MPAPSDKITVLDIRDSDLDLGVVYDAVRDDEAGGIAIFVGTVRRHDNGLGVDGLGYTAHPTAAEALREVAAEVAGDESVIKVAAAHRTGDLGIGDIAVVVAVSAAHRGQAFASCRRLIDELKGRVPIWKHQVFSDGSDEWVGTP
ncbi:MAG: molybdenum cofactor biosynthesis protein MoaE [Nocardioidaceae bacterium]|nr:molybdenum cofactor biosynthesis protein MoaE [Nocardioidaceae bacterium]